MEWISYQHLKNKEIVTNLYSDYTNIFDNVAKFYNGNYKKKSDWTEKLAVLQNTTYNRSLLLRVLNEQNREYHSGIKTLANIDLIQNENTFAVVTGQQLGILTGPLYTLYKAITAVKLAEHLTQEYPEFNFVPIFWLEGEDHDFEEINKIHFINSASELVMAEYLYKGIPLEKNIGAAGNVIIDETIEKFYTELSSQLPHTEYTQPLLEIVKGYYKPGNTLLKAFTGFFNHFYENSGLIFFNPNNVETKQLLIPLFLQELDSDSAVSKLVIQKSAELEERYHAQVKGKSVNLFMFHKEGRFSIEPSENDYYLKNTRQRFSSEELHEAIQSTPEKFSPNVVLRPLCQDTILPTVAYVGGPAEIAYFAQFKPVYEYFKIPMPFIYPRSSLTIIEEKIQRILEKYSLTVIDIFEDLETILTKISEQVSEVKVESLFDGLSLRLKEAVQEARFGIQQIDPTLSGTVDNLISKIEQQLEVLKNKTQKAQQMKEEISLKQIRKAALHIFPNGNFQERELSVLHFLNKYGPDFIRWIENELMIEKFQHQIVTI
ncbi:MAG: bacillithiol biosynthesis cysteine-adding enzyme BshC [Bacteroidetes bacterium]|nr:bacillithiol biosynthesis cysteine-adding enzyme BshC [Bacteroidota bacterium]